MFEASDFEVVKITNLVFGVGTYPKVETWTMKIYSDTVGLDGTGGTELTVGGYDSVDFGNDDVYFPTTTARAEIKGNAVVIQTDVFTDDSPAIKSIGFFDENGNLRYRKIYPDNTVYVLSGNVFKFDTNYLTFNPS